MRKNIRYHEAFGINATELKKLGVYDGYIDKDSKFYVFPKLFKNLQIEEFKDSYTKYQSYFSNIVKILKFAKVADKKDKFFKEALKRFQFHELAHVGLGYSKSNKRGSGVGKVFAEQLALSAFDIVKAGIDDPEIFELVGLLEEGIGADRISDIFISILTEDFLNYTQNVASKLELNTANYILNDTIFKLPFYNNIFIVFVPREVLIKLPVAFDRHDISDVCMHNETLRANVNQIISEAFESGSLKKDLLKNLLLKNPKIANKLIQTYQNKINSSYDFDYDPSGDFVWQTIAKEYSSEYPISIDKNKKPIEIVNNICEHYKNLVENNGLFKMFHNPDGTYRPESFAQMLFFAIADSYCTANNLDISPESDSGRGPVDFKVSKGLTKVNVEMKLSKNPKLLHGYENQLPIYDKAEKTNNSIFFIVLLDESHMKSVKKVFDYRLKNETLDKKLPQIIVVDATIKKSASKSLF